MKNVTSNALGQAQPSIVNDKSTEPPTEMQTQDHMHHLIKAHEIINNPVKMQAIHALAGRHSKAIKSIQDIKSHFQNNYGGPGGGPKNNLSALEENEESDNENTNY